MRKFTKIEKINGELACRNLSAKADGVYSTSDPLEVYEVSEKEYTGDECTGYKNTYYVRGIIDADDLSFDELNELFEEFADEVKEVEA